MAQLDFVIAEVEREIGYFRWKRNYNRTMALVFICAAAVLSALATVSLGASKMLNRPGLEVVALVATGLATVIGAVAAVMSHRKLWHINNVALAALSKLQWDIQYRVANEQQTIYQSEIDGFYSRFMGIIEEADKSWIATYAIDNKS